MKITRRQLSKIIKEEIHAVVSENFLSRLGSKIGISSKDTTRAIISYTSAYEEALALAKKVLDTDANSSVVKKYKQSKIELLDAAAAAREAMQEKGATGDQEIDFDTVDGDFEDYFRPAAKKADRLIDEKARGDALLQRLTQAAEEKERAAEERLERLSSKVRDTKQWNKDREERERQAASDELGAKKLHNYGQIGWEGDQDCLNRCVEDFRSRGDNSEQALEKCKKDCAGSRASVMYR